MLGLSFKGESDDIRDLLSIKLLKYLKRKKIKTFYSDEFYKMSGNLKKKDLIKKSNIIIICAPHKAYKKLQIPKNKIIIDVWGLRGKKFKMKNKNIKNYIFIGGKNLGVKSLEFMIKKKFIPK